MPSEVFKRSGCEKQLGVVRWGLVFLMLVACAESQTFQYSRGWTNGKRSGGGVYPILGGPYDQEESPLEVFLPPAPGRLQMNLSPTTRFRSPDANQYIVKRMAPGTGGASRKPLWFGTILGVDGQATDSGLPSNSSPTTGGSRTSPNDF